MGFTKWMLPGKAELSKMIKEDPERVRILASRDALMGPDESMKLLDKFIKKDVKTGAKQSSRVSI